MCPPPEDKAVPAGNAETRSNLKKIIGVLALMNIGCLIAIIVMATNKSSSSSSSSAVEVEAPPAPVEVPVAAPVEPEAPKEYVHVHDHTDDKEEEPAAEDAMVADTVVEEKDEVASEPAVEEANTVVEEKDEVESEETVELSAEERSLAAFLDAKGVSSFFSEAEDNTCAGKKIALDNDLCVNMEVAPQAGANVTKGYVGGLEVGELAPNTKPYYQSSMCPVNVHWHLGTEHYSAGEYDELGDGPHGNVARPDWAQRERDLAEGKVRDGFRCRHYDAAEEKFTKEYDWKHCEGMEVGETYEVHWPHSAAGACGTVNQYQTPFYDGVFCNLNMETLVTLQAQDIANAVGVHGQVFTIVNDEEYFYPDLIRGMLVDGEHGQDMAIYTGSTTGTSRSNEVCSAYAPITWQVDRKCHMISASSFDKMCYDMKMQRDDMSGDLHAHGSRELVHDKYVANNQYDKGSRKNLRA